MADSFDLRKLFYVADEIVDFIELHIRRKGVLGEFANWRKLVDVSVGLYLMVWHNDPVYVGRAVQVGRGLRTRIADYIRKSQSGRKTEAGRWINRHRNEIVVSVFPIGENLECASLTRLFEVLLINRLHPPLNITRLRHEFIKDHP